MRIRTGYSFHNAYGHLDEVASRLKEIGWPRQPISDTTSTYAFTRWSKMVPKPLYGIELAVAQADLEKAPIDLWSFFAIKDLGTLHRLVGLATKQPKDEDGNEIRKSVSLSYEQAQKAKGVVKVAGNRALLEHMHPRTENLFVALSPSMPIGLYRQARDAGYKFIASSDNAYPRIEDKEIYRLALGRRSNVATYPQHILMDQEWRDAISFASKHDMDQALRNRNKMFELCVAKLGRATMFVPEKPKSLREMCIIGAKRKGCNLKDKVYAARLEHELHMIAEKKFEDYFYIIADIIQYSKQHMIVGPARGSSSGSLVCYLLDITAIDPIPYGLIFERFIDVNRADLPDIDIDFSDAKRDMAFKYVEDKYGRDHVARLGTVGFFRPRSALNAAGAALHIPKYMIEKVLDSLIEYSSGDTRASHQLEDTLATTEAGQELVEKFPMVTMVSKLEDHPTNSSQHAAGVVVTAEPVERYVAIDQRSFSAMCDKKDAEELNLLKIDMLGLTQLSIFERTLELIKKPFVGYFEALPLDDRKAFKVLNDRKYSGIFQFNGRALQGLSKQIDFTQLEDIVAITALARPGPMGSGGAMRWVKRRIGEEPVEYPHPAFKPFLEESLGTMIYQETIMLLGREIGDLSWDDVTQLRKSMSKSLGKEYFDQFGDRWKAGAIKKGIPRNVLDKVWDDMCAYGNWSFNRAHAVAYGLVSYYCCYLKAHYPLEFAAATLDAEAMADKQIKVLRELHYEGVKYQPVDTKHSDLLWAIKGTGRKRLLVGPLTMIHGIGGRMAQEVLDCRATKTKLRPALQRKLDTAITEIDSIFPIHDKLNEIFPNYPDMSSAEISMPHTLIRDVDESINGDVLIIGVITKLAPKDENEAINVAKRGHAVEGPHWSLNVFIRDDGDEIYCKINRYDYETLGKQMIENTRVGRSIYAIKGKSSNLFRAVWVSNIKYLGEMGKGLSVAPDKGGNVPSSDYTDNIGITPPGKAA
jgi:DNA polymerase III alpha subunit